MGKNFNYYIPDHGLVSDQGCKFQLYLSWSQGLEGRMCRGHSSFYLEWLVRMRPEGTMHYQI